MEQKVRACWEIATWLYDLAVRPQISKAQLEIPEMNQEVSYLDVLYGKLGNDDHIR